MRLSLLTLFAICTLVLPVTADEFLTELAQYEYGQDQSGLLAIEREAERSMSDPQHQAAMAAMLLAVMTDPDATLAGKQHASILLRMCGGEAEVPALARMLQDDALREFARGALERIPDSAAGEALREALGTLQGPGLVGVIHSTANRADRAAVASLIGLTEHDEADVALAAAHALGRIGGAEAAACLKVLAQPGADAVYAHAYLASGFLAAEEGDRTLAAAAFDALADARYPVPVRRGALAGQLRLADDPTTLLTRWLDGEDAAARRVAADNLAGQSSEWLTAACENKPALAAIAFAEVLAMRGLAAALPVLMAAAGQDAPPALRVRALAAMGRVADTQAVALLMDALDADTLSSRAAMTSLLAVPHTMVDGAIAEALHASNGRKRTQLIDLLVMRRMTGAIPVLLELATIEDDAGLRGEVSAALIELGDESTLPGLVATVLLAKDAQHRDRIESTYMEIAKRHGKTVAPIVAAMTDDSKINKLLPLLGRVGGAEALAKVEEAVAHQDADRRAAGIRALCNWPDASVAEQLAALVEGDGERAVRVSSLRAYIRVTSLESDRPASATREMLQWAFEKAERPDERALAVQRVHTVREMETLRWLVCLLDHEEPVAEEACRSIVELAHHRFLRNPNRDEFNRALKRVIDTSKDRQTVERAKGYLAGV